MERKRPMPSYLTPSLAFDRAAIMRAAWSMARQQLQAATNPSWPFKPYATTLRKEFASALRRVWDLAKSFRALKLWAAERDAGAAAEAARRAALPLRDRQIEDARTALVVAEHADRFTAAHNAAVIDAQARLHALQHAA